MNSVTLSNRWFSIWWNNDPDNKEKPNTCFAAEKLIAFIKVECEFDQFCQIVLILIVFPNNKD